MGTRTAAPAQEGRSTRRRRVAWSATVGILGTAALVALLASRPGSPMTPPLFPGAEAPSFLRWLTRILGIDELSRDAVGILAAVALVAAAWSFVYALREAWAGRLTLRRIFWVAVILHVIAVIIPLFLSRDVYSYAIYGRMVSVHGVNPYVDIPASFIEDPVYPLVSVDWIDSPSVYGPAFVVISAAVTGVFSSPPSMVLAFKVLAAVASLGTMVLAVAGARRIRPERAAFAAVLVGWNPVIVFHGVAGGHNDALVGLALAAGVLLILSGRELWATAVLVLGTLVKISGGVPLAIAILAAVFRRPKGQRLKALATHAGIGLAVALPFIVPFEQTEDPSLGALELTSRQGWLAPSRFVLVVLRGTANFLGGDLAGDVVSVVVRVGFPLIFFVVLVALIRHLATDPRRIEPPLVVAAMGWATLVALMISPLLYPWYAMWLVPVAWLVPRPARDGAVVVSVALAITELVAEPSRAPRVWEAMVFGLHYVATPIVLVVLIRLLLELRRRLRAGPAHGWSDPLLLETAPVPRSGDGQVRGRWPRRRPQAAT
jgi:alpha-1,6-mannosyltransferase